MSIFKFFLLQIFIQRMKRNITKLSRFKTFQDGWIERKIIFRCSISMSLKWLSLCWCAFSSHILWTCESMPQMPEKPFVREDKEWLTIFDENGIRKFNVVIEPVSEKSVKTEITTKKSKNREQGLRSHSSAQRLLRRLEVTPTPRCYSSVSLLLRHLEVTMMPRSHSGASGSLHYLCIGLGPRTYIYPSPAMSEAKPWSPNVAAISIFCCPFYGPPRHRLRN